MNAYHTDEARQIHHDVKHCSAEELLQLHGIEIGAGGVVFDHTYMTEHASVDDWILSSYTDDYEEFEKFSNTGEHEFY
jgi:hypothetical protein